MIFIDHNEMRKLNFIIVFLILTGCSCKASHMQKAEVVHDDDPYKDCSQLLFSITEARVMIEYTEERNRYPYVFMSYPICMPVVQINALENQFILEDRLKYLNALYDDKKCNIPAPSQSEILAAKKKEEQEYIVNKVNLIPTDTEYEG